MDLFLMICILGILVELKVVVYIYGNVVCIVNMFCYFYCFVFEDWVWSGNVFFWIGGYNMIIIFVFLVGCSVYFIFIFSVEEVVLLIECEKIIVFNLWLL